MELDAEPANAPPATVTDDSDEEFMAPTVYDPSPLSIELRGGALRKIIPFIPILFRTFLA